MTSDLVKERDKPAFVPMAVWQRWLGLQPNVQGAVWVLAAAVLFSIMAMLVKFIGQGLSAPQIAFFRGLTGLLFISPFLVRMGWRSVVSTRPVLQVVRGIIGASGMLLGFHALVHLPLADSNAISFARVLFLVPLAYFLLGERAGPRRLTATLVGFAGVLVILRPTGSIEFAAITAVVSAFLVACAIVSVKLLSKSDSPVTLQFYAGVFGVLFTAVPAAFSWQMPTAEQWFWLTLMGAAGAAAHWCFLRGYQIGETTALAPYDYARLLFAALWGLLLFGEWPTLATYLGALLIVGSTLYITIREQTLKKQADPKPKESETPISPDAP